jgi:chromosome partitioning protein
MTQIVAVANQKGGVGKTTTVISLAACVAELGRRVLVVDLDPQANATSGLGVQARNETCLYESLLAESPTGDLVRPTCIERVDAIPSELDLAGCEVEIARRENYLHCLSHVLNPWLASRGYDLVLLDCPPSLGILTMNGLTAAHSVLVPMQCEYYALEGLSVMSSLINRLRGSAANPGLTLEGILMTMFDGRTNLAQQVVSEVRTHFGEKVYETIIPRNVRVSEAPSYGQPITVYDSFSPGARAYRFFAREFLKRLRDNAPAAALAAPVVTPPPSGGQPGLPTESA